MITINSWHHHVDQSHAYSSFQLIKIFWYFSGFRFSKQHFRQNMALELGGRVVMISPTKYASSGRNSRYSYFMGLIDSINLNVIHNQTSSFINLYFFLQ